MKQLIGVIPAAGVGTRLSPYNGAKELLPVGAQHILINGKREERPKIVSQYIIEAMVEAGIKHIIIVVHPNKYNFIGLHLDGSMYGANICYIVQTPQSMVHSIDLAYDWIKSSTVVMGMPDTIVLPKNSLQQLIQHHKDNVADLSLGLFPTDRPNKFGMIKTDNDANIIYHEDKPKHTDATSMWGLAVWEPSFTQKLHEQIKNIQPSNREIALGDIFDIMIKQGRRCKAYQITEGKYYDIGTYDEYKKAILEL